MNQSEALLMDERRLKWQNNTKETILSKLSTSYEYSIVSDNRDRKVIVVFGYPQVGKTTFILRLIGIEAQYEPIVNEILRADIKYGNSSTSTAIIYGQSPNNDYGIANGSIDENGDIEYCNDKKMKKRLKDIREQVENNKRSAKAILRIYLPKKYFRENPWGEDININIIDMPGLESKNENEHIHVNNIARTYIPMATVNIIVTRIDEIAQIEHFQDPLGNSPKRLPHKYIIVATRAYSPEKKRDEWCEYSSWEKIKKAADNECVKQLKKRLKFLQELPHIIPVEMGQSFNQLKEINGNYCNNVYYAVEKTLEETRKKIIDMKGNQFSGWIDDIKAMNRDINTQQIEPKQQKLKKIENKITVCKNKVSAWEERLDNTSKRTEEGYEEYNNLIRELADFDIDYDEKVKEMQASILDENYKFKDKEYKKDKGLIKREFEKLFDSVIEEIIENCQKICKDYGIAESEVLNLPKTLCNDIADDFQKGLSDEILPSKVWIIEFQSKKISKRIEIGKTLLEQYCNQSKEKYIKRVNELISQKVKKIKDKNVLYNTLVNRCQKSINEYNKKLKNLQDDRKNLIKEINQLKKISQKDIKRLENYKDIAYEEYKKQYDEIKKDIYSGSYSETDRVYLILLLGLITQDFKKLGD